MVCPSDGPSPSSGVYLAGQIGNVYLVHKRGTAIAATKADCLFGRPNRRPCVQRPHLVPDGRVLWEKSDQIVDQIDHLIVDQM